MSRISVTREGLALGGIASVSVAAFYAAFDLLAARGPLYTVNVLGRALFGELRHPTTLALPLPLDWGAIALYSGLHLLIALAIGLVVAALVAHAERRPSRATAVLLVLVGGFVVTVLAVGFLSAPIRPVLPWWSIVVANALAVVVAGSYLLRRHPGLWRRLVPVPVEGLSGQRP